ncbi:hypothetical protein [Stenotrophomonas sp. 278]|nr:hypothetical protein [Stenotrophomonas sp. 278]
MRSGHKIFRSAALRFSSTVAKFPHFLLHTQIFQPGASLAVAPLSQITQN